MLPVRLLLLALAVQCLIVARLVLGGGGRHVRIDEDSIFDEMRDLDMEVMTIKRRSRSLLGSVLPSSKLNMNEMKALNDFYDAMKGVSWKWNKDHEEYGVPWNFSTSLTIAGNNASRVYIHDPCTKLWQGVFCSCGNATNEQPLHYYYYYGDIDENNATCSVQIIALNRFGLEGPFPSNIISRFVSLEHLFLSDNNIGGPVANLSSLPRNLTILSLYQNKLTSTFPANFGKLLPQQLIHIELSYNSIRGTIPIDIGALTALQYLSFKQNLLAFSMPTSIGLLRNLKILRIDFNNLAGTLPSSIGFCSSLKTLALARNLFSGTLPSSISSLTTMSLLSVRSNNFTGAIPPLKNMTKLNYLFAYDNFFEMHIEDLFDTKVQNDLQVVDISNNTIRGQLPPSLFQNNPKLYSFGASSTCLEGTLPGTLCNATSLQYLILDGMKCNSKCINQPWSNSIFSYFFNGTIPEYMVGTIPSCLFFQLPLLTSLRLSGNGFTGTIPNIISPILTDVSLTHNFVNGSIPLNWKTAFSNSTAMNLDLNNNKIRGNLTGMSLTPEGVSNSSLDVIVNRLTGPIPEELLNMKHISILRSNRFACPPSTQTTNSLDYVNFYPKNDDYRMQFTCGSLLLEQGLGVFACYISILLLLLAVVYVAGTTHFCFSKAFIEDKNNTSFIKRFYAQAVRITDWNSILNGSIPLSDELIHRTRGIAKVLEILRFIRKVSARILFVLLLVFLPTYVALTELEGSHDEAYMWSTTAAYFSGPQATSVLFVFWFVLLAYVAALLSPNEHEEELEDDDSGRATDEGIRQGSSMGSRRSSRASLLRASLLERVKKIKLPIWMPRFAYKGPKIVALICCRLLLLLSINLLVMVSLNVAYVFSTLSSNASKHSLTAAGVAIAKIFWNLMAMPNLQRSRLLRFGLSLEKDIGDQHYLSAFIIFLNNFIVPCAATLSTSTECFHDLFVSPPPVNVSILYKGRKVSTNPSFVETTKYFPPFLYNYQCTSGLLLSYVPVYLFMYTFLAFFAVIKNALLRFNADHGFGRENRVVIGSTIRLLDRLMLTHKERKVLRSTSVLSCFRERKVDSSTQDGDNNTSIDEHNGEKQVALNDFYGVRLFLINEISNFVILGTFGSTAPLLAGVIVLSVIANSLNESLLIGRFIYNEYEREKELREDGKAIGFDGINQLDFECRSLSASLLQKFVWLFLSLQSAFFAFFLFDTLGDTNQFDAGLHCAVSFVFAPIYIFVFKRAFLFVFSKFSPPPPPSFPPSGDASIETVPSLAVDDLKRSSDKVTMSTIYRDEEPSSERFAVSADLELPAMHQINSELFVCNPAHPRTNQF